jgi:hypothetical protein
MYATRDGATLYGKKVLTEFLKWAATNPATAKYVAAPGWKTLPLWKRLQTLQKLGNWTGKLTIWRERRGVHAKESHAIATCKIRGLRRKRAKEAQPVNPWGQYMVNWQWNRDALDSSEGFRIILQRAILAGDQFAEVGGVPYKINRYVTILKPVAGRAGYKKFRMPQMEYRVAGEAPAPGHPQVGIWR